MKVLDGKLLEFGEFQLDTEQKILRRGGEIVALPLKSVELLCVLAENSGEVVSNNDLMQQVWVDSFVEESVLTQNIYLLRKTLQTNDGKNLIKNVPRRGYVFYADTSFPHETIIERHLSERIEIEETIEEQKEPILRGGKSSTFRLPVLAITVLLVLSSAIGAYFYFRGDSQKAVTPAAPELKLKAVSAPSAIKSLAILPLKSADEIFAASFSNDLSIRLGSFNKFTVTPFALAKDAEKHDAELQADFVLKGEVQAKDKAFSANVRVLDTKTGAEIWANKFEFDNIIQLQDAIANQVAKEIEKLLTPEERERISKRLPTNLAAYEYFQTGYALWRKRADGKAYFQKAIELDQSFARAYVGLASVKMMDGVKDSPAAKEAEELLKKAFELDENLADAYAVQGFIRIFHYRDWEGAEKSLKNALELDANNVNAHHWLGIFYSIHRRLDEAKAEMRKALELDPTNPTLLGDIGQLYYFAGEKDTAIEYCRKALNIEPNHLFSAEGLARINQPQEIFDKEATLKQLNQNLNENAFVLPYINVDPQYDSLRDEPRFREILRKMNLNQ